MSRVNRPDDLESMTHQIDKDVQRTDRASDYYSGENNEHLRTLMYLLAALLLYQYSVIFLYAGEFS